MRLFPSPSATIAWKLLRDDGLPPVGAQPGPRLIEESRKLDQFRRRNDRVAESDIDLETHPGRPEPSFETDTNPFVLVVVSNAVGSNGVREESEPVIFYVDSAHRAEEILETRPLWSTSTEEVDVACRSMRGVGPQVKKNVPLEDEVPRVLRLAQTVEPTLDSVAGEEEIEVLAPPARQVE